jgi:hypothetical protein
VARWFLAHDQNQNGTWSKSKEKIRVAVSMAISSSWMNEFTQILNRVREWPAKD